MIDVVKTITNVAKSVAPQVINQAQRNEIVVRILKELKLDPTQPPKDVDGVYVYSLVEYGAFKPEPILELLRKKEIKKAFWDAYTSNNPLGFADEVEKIIVFECSSALITELRKLDIRQELEEFGKAFINVAKRTKSSEFQPCPNWNMDEYPEEFKPLIQEKIREFCGRGFVFEAFDKFKKTNRNGYFTVVGYAGMGKSAIAAKYVYDHKCPCYFNILAEGRNRPELFLESVRQQLIKRYQLQDAEKADLSTLLEKVSKNLPEGERLVIVVDALDEVEQEPGGNLLHLPQTLPEGVYFLLTRRPYEAEKKRLTLSPGVPVEELDLRASQYVNLSRDDVKTYIRLVLDKDPDYRDSLRKWIQDRNIHNEGFIEEVAQKSENNFMYLRYVLPDIAQGKYDDLSLKQLPNGLQDYYQQHWIRMGMDEKPQEDKVIVLFILVESKTPPTCALIAEIAKQDESDVEDVLNKWVEYLKKQKIDGEVCYSIYHASFLDFLKGKRKLQRTRKLFEEVATRMAYSLYSDI